SVLENMKIAGYLRTRKEIKKTMQYVFELFPALINLKKRKAGFLSGGEQQMLAIGMALIVQPELLLLDEPLLGLSPIMQKSVVDAIKALNKSSGITVILSEQFARPVLPMIDKGYVVENGMLSLSGTGEELMNNPEIKAAYFGV
ncbi:MAG: ATP-binding cassette domain-containing protein, partial [Desulfobacula sp.]|nr:ATP-binding cassette domain-containing protein [Desulfobacula sp.]MBT7261312.1 ATP-binding cassette domain-containing protein [Desulfobacula sp.]